MAGGFLLAWWTDEDYKDVVAAAKVRSGQARARGAKLLRGITEEECFPRDIEGCMGEKMFNRGMGWSEEWLPFRYGEPDSNGWEVKTSATWPNLFVTNPLFQYPHRPVCRVKLIPRDKLAIIGGWCFIRDAKQLSHKPGPDRAGVGFPDGVLIRPQVLRGIEEVKGVNGKDVFDKHWLDMNI